jgi:hypothetical protein
MQVPVDILRFFRSHATASVAHRTPKSCCPPVSAGGRRLGYGGIVAQTPMSLLAGQPYLKNEKPRPAGLGDQGIRGYVAHAR